MALIKSKFVSCLIGYFLICNLLHLTSQARQIQFSMVTSGLSWLRRTSAKLEILDSSFNDVTHHSAFPSSFLLYGGWTDPYLANANDLWSTTDAGLTWNSINTTSVYPSSPGCTFCTDRLTDHRYAISKSPINRTSVWSSTSPTDWTAIEPIIIYNLTQITSPFVDRFGASCVVDSRSRVHYLLGLNMTALSGPSQYYNDTWTSSDHGRTWDQTTSTIPFAPRYGAMTGIHLNNTYLNGLDIMYILGGTTRDSQGYERYLHDLWVSSDGATSWSAIEVQNPWGTGFTSSFALDVTKDGILILSTMDLQGQSSELWISLDGGYNWGCCLRNAPYRERIMPCLATDLGGYVYLMGGRSFGRSPGYYDDIWKSSVSVYDWSQWAEACNTTVPATGVGLSVWPGVTESSSSSSTSASLPSSSSSPSSNSAASSSSSSSSSSLNSGASSSSSSSGLEYSSSSSSPNLVDSSTGEPQPRPNPETSNSTLLTIIVTVGLVLLSLVGLLLYLWYVKRKYGRLQGWCCRKSSTPQALDPRGLLDSASP